MRNSLSILLLGLGLPSFHHVLALTSFGKSLNRSFRFRNGRTMPTLKPDPKDLKMPDLAGVDKDITNIYENNRRWKEGKIAENADYFTNLGATHAPTYLWIGCSDARVPANEIMGEDAGSVFVVRNVANLVVNTDFNLMAALQFGVNVLKIPHIIVCGHYDCGGVRASIENVDHVPPLENWLRNIRDVYRLHRDELDSISDPELRHRRLVELNVIEQCINLFKTGAVQRQRVETYKLNLPYTTPRIHACVFDPKVGDLIQLEVDFKEYIEDLHNIYDLYIVDKDEIADKRTESKIQRTTPHAPQSSVKVNYNRRTGGKNNA